MNKEEFLNHLQIDGKLITKRCTENYLKKNNLLNYLDDLVSKDFGSISDRIKYLKHGGGYCLVCNTRTELDSRSGGFARYCKEHFHHSKKNKKAHNSKDIDIDLVKKLYFEENKSLLEISQILGNVSNVTLKKKLEENGIELRNHSDNQKLHAKRGYTKPQIIIDRKELIELYSEQKIPVKVLAEKYSCDSETIRRFLKQEGIERIHRTSSIEWKIKDYLDQNNIQYIYGSRKIIPPLETDFYLPQFNLAFEINGLYIHSFYSGKKEKNYHYEKYIQHKNKGIRLIQIWEDDIEYNFDLIKSRINNYCNLINNKLDARKCDIRELKFHEIKTFCDEHHHQKSPAKNNKGIGLFYENRLISLVTYIILNDIMIITRFCSLKFYNVRGAFSKLLKTLKGIGYNIKTYSSNDISDGGLYLNNGFECVSEKIDMYYTDYDIILNRQGFMKNKLKTILENYDESKTEVDNMIQNGYDVIYKSGVKTWFLKNT